MTSPLLPSQGKVPRNFILLITCHSVTTGGTIRFKNATDKASISVLIPGDHDFIQRECRRHLRWYLVRWFRKVEARVWEFVTAYYGRQRPKRVFLVTGQTLTQEYSISHQQRHSTGCEVYLGGGFGIPNIIEGHTYWGYEIGRVQASLGFEISARRSEERPQQLHSIFFETESSGGPMNRFLRLKPRSRQSRQIERMYQ